MSCDIDDSCAHEVQTKANMLKQVRDLFINLSLDKKSLHMKAFIRLLLLFYNELNRFICTPNLNL